MIRVVVNGRDRELPEGSTLADLLEGRPGCGPGGCGRGTAIELEGRVIPPSEWGSTLLEDGQEVELVRIVGGG